MYLGLSALVEFYLFIYFTFLLAMLSCILLLMICSWLAFFVRYEWELFLIGRTGKPNK